jgi:hypothetical protein
MHVKNLMFTLCVCVRFGVLCVRKVICLFLCMCVCVCAIIYITCAIVVGLFMMTVFGNHCTFVGSLIQISHVYSVLSAIFLLLSRLCMLDVSAYIC